MFVVDAESRKITMHRGDTGTVVYRLTGYTLEGNVKVVWTMKNKYGDIIKEGVYTPEDNKVRIEFLNSDTDSIAPGVYLYDLRVVIEPEYDTQGRIVDGVCVTTPVSPLYVEIMDTVGII